MGWLADSASVYFLRRPAYLRILTGILQRLNPVASIGRTTIVTRTDDIQEVLEKHNHFEFDPFAPKRMLLGDFLLALNPYPVVEAEKNLLAGIIDALTMPKGSSILEGELDRICPAYAAILAGELNTNRRVDLVKVYIEPAVIQLVIDFFGIPAPAGAKSEVFKGSGSDLLAQWLRKVGSVIATVSPAPFGLQGVAEKAGRELMAHLKDSIEKRWSVNNRSSDTVLDQLLDHVLAERERSLAGPQTTYDAPLTKRELDFVCRNLGGLVLAGSTPLIKAFSHGLQQLLERPDRPRHGHGASVPVGCPRPPLYAAMQAAQHGEVDALEALFFEALRFNPTFPVLTRFCPRTTNLSSDTRRECEVPAGSTVLAPPIAAMFDRDKVREPDLFGYQRPEDNYMHFGFGGHVCLGQPIARATLVSLAKAFLTLKEVQTLRTHAVRDMRMRYDGPAVDAFKVEMP